MGCWLITSRKGSRLASEGRNAPRLPSRAVQDIGALILPGYRHDTIDDRRQMINAQRRVEEHKSDALGCLDNIRLSRQSSSKWASEGIKEKVPSPPNIITMDGI